MSSAAVADEQRYSLADLKALVSQRSYGEAVQHLSDIAPREHGADWLAVAIDAASGYVGDPGTDSAAKI